MQYKDCIKKIVGIQGVILKNVNDFGKVLNFNLETKPKLQTCPVCGHKTKKIHDYRFQKIRHFCLNDSRVVFITLRKRRYICKHCNKKFYENYNFLQKYFRITSSVY